MLIRSRTRRKSSSKARFVTSFTSVLHRTSRRRPAAADNYRSIGLSHQEIRNTNRISWSSAEAQRSFTEDTRGCSSVSVWMQMTTSLRTSRLSISSWKCWINFLGMCVNWTWSLISTRYVLRQRGWQQDSDLLVSRAVKGCMDLITVLIYDRSTLS